jgi:hypothetical protein
MCEDLLFNGGLTGVWVKVERLQKRAPNEGRLELACTGAGWQMGFPDYRLSGQDGCFDCLEVSQSSLVPLREATRKKVLLTLATSRPEIRNIEEIDGKLG